MEFITSSSTDSTAYLAPRRKDSSYTGETGIGRTEIGTVFQVARNGRAIKAEDGGSDAGEEAQPGTQGN